MNLTLSWAMLAFVLIVAPTLRAQSPAGADTNSLKVLRQTLVEQQRHPDQIIRTATDAPVTQAQADAAKASSQSAAAALERQFLEGKLSARQYQKALAALERGNKPPGIAASPKVSPRPPPALEPAIPTPPPKQTEKQKKVSDVESKLDAMIKEKEARDRAAQTNAPAAPGPQATKRERLDFLLKQVVAGKLSDEEYKKEREKILAQPD